MSGLGTFQSGSGKTILTDGINEGQIKSDGSIKIIESDTSVEPGSEIKFLFNSEEELIYIERLVGSIKQRKRVIDTSYVGGTDLASVTRTTTFTKYDTV